LRAGVNDSFNTLKDLAILSTACLKLYCGVKFLCIEREYLVSGDGTELHDFRLTGETMRHLRGTA